MRWDALFADLDQQFEAARAAELAAEVADRTRREHALVALSDRVAASVGAPLTLHVQGAGLLRVRLVDAGPDWLLAAPDDGGGEMLVPSGAVLAVGGLSSRVQHTGPDQLGRRLDLRWALRGIARDRGGVTLLLVDGSRLSGTLDRVGADHVDLAEHAPGEPRRAAQVRGVRSVPLTALGALRRS